ncbi:glycosyltransferase family 2 protein [Paenibacillus sp. S3N08]|uniref:Glycosyltransferase family 2 protein n=2 Tax=Paenibacillus agricola TaxID=2716264 RepID=A0ABX0JEW4_9BACL|nr:glycosyltransferase family 2 protein [Paenibacillus agricola]
MDNVFRNYGSQDYTKKELIIILNRDGMDLTKWQKNAKGYQDVSIYQRPSKVSLGECLNYGIKRCKYNTIAKMDDDDYYTPEYLSQQMKAMKKKKADLVCKRTVYMYFKKEKTLALHLDNKEVNTFLTKEGGIKGSTLVFKKKVGKKVKFPEINRGEDTFFSKKCIEKNYKIYVTDKKNYVCLRSSKRYHTWDVNNNHLMKKSKILCKTTNYKEYIEKRRRGNETR